MVYRTCRVRSVDIETGEVIDGHLVAVPTRKPGLDTEFMMMRQAAVLQLAANANLNGQDLRVLLAYIGCADWENNITVTQKWIANHLGMRQQHVHRSTKKLVEAKILIEGEKIGRHKAYQLNELYGWKGDSENYQKKVKEGVDFSKPKKVASK